MEVKLFVTVIIVLCCARVQAAVNCTSTGVGRFADPSDSTCKNYTLCVASGSTFLSYNYVCPSTSLFNPAASYCTTNYTCDANTTATNNTSCTEDGWFADPNSSDCSSYIECVDIDGTFIESTLSCPNNTYYNPNTTLCESTYNCTSTTSFTCSSAGRFADTSDIECKTYYFCVLQANGTFVQYDYTCPSTSVFNPNTKTCTTSYNCT